MNREHVNVFFMPYYNDPITWTVVKKRTGISLYSKKILSIGRYIFDSYIKLSSYMYYYEDIMCL